MPELRRISKADFELVYPFLSGVDPHANIEKETWKRLFYPNWDIEESCCGYALVENEKVVGFLGFVFCSREINGRLEKFCNMTTWYVNEDNRAHSILLLYPFLGLDGYTLTNFTASGRVNEILKKVGFKTLENHSVILKASLFPAFLWRRKASLFVEGSGFESMLNEKERQIYRDHLPYECIHALIRSKQGNCYLVMSKLEIARKPILTVRYLGNPQILKDCGAGVLVELLSRQKASCLQIDKRMLRGVQLKRGIVHQSHVEKLYKSETLNVSSIDNLYSELVLLGI